METVEQGIGLVGPILLLGCCAAIIGAVVWGIIHECHAAIVRKAERDKMLREYADQVERAAYKVRITQ